MTARSTVEMPCTMTSGTIWSRDCRLARKPLPAVLCAGCISTPRSPSILHALPHSSMKMRLDSDLGVAAMHRLLQGKWLCALACQPDWLSVSFAVQCLGHIPCTRVELQCAMLFSMCKIASCVGAYAQASLSYDAACDIALGGACLMCSALSLSLLWLSRATATVRGVTSSCSLLMTSGSSWMLMKPSRGRRTALMCPAICPRAVFSSRPFTTRALVTWSVTDRATCATKQACISGSVTSNAVCIPGGKCSICLPTKPLVYSVTCTYQ